MVTDEVLGALVLDLVWYDDDDEEEDMEEFQG